MATLPLKSSRNEQHAVIRFVGKRTYHTRPTVRTWPSVTTVFLGPTKKILGGQKFAADTEVQLVVRQWLGQQPASFFASGIQKLVNGTNVRTNLDDMLKNETLIFNIYTFYRCNISLLSLFVFSCSCAVNHL